MYVMGFILTYQMVFKFDIAKLVDDIVKVPGMPHKNVVDLH